MASVVMSLLKYPQRLVQVIPTLLAVYYAYMLEYRAELMFWVLSGSFPLILMGLWQEAARSGQFELNPDDVVRYFLAVFVVRQLTVVWVIWDFEREVLEGKLSPLLLQPLDPGWRHFSSHLAERLARLPFIAALVALFLVLYPVARQRPTHIVWGLVAISLAFCLRFLMQYTYAMMAFWVERATAIEQFSFLLYTFFSGMVAPLTLFPETVRAIVMWTPFPYLIYVPASLMVGLPIQIGKSILITLAWCLIFWCFNRLLWRQGLKRYSGMGA
ncbi:multidrug ABC transporter permease [Leptolyngbyaceae cyanobacterium CCMR0082]|uniref:Multidrug ABC transporter permease n=2 Tax=Adonisia turfae TaxID=2950184 RepID=A0A6M0SBV5_9CYAN|nr:ABC-2 family transporter protein [Adonisia turfae]NEZ55916.1 multidrug ABC transporter permease [Adonisia turfae CCMR0081]NEZ65979.1 multidrug ABC transporter permease [Adonisia turfae CCMR0082]